MGVRAAGKSLVGRLGWTGGTLIVTGWLGFMFATAVAAVVPSVHAVTAPIVCHAPFTHFVVHTDNSVTATAPRRGTRSISPAPTTPGCSAP